MKILLLVDADWIAFQMASACQYPNRWDDGVWTPHVNEADVFNAIDARMNYIKEQTGAKKIVMCLSGSKNWRKDVMPTYKGNRDPNNRPLALQAAREYIMEKYEILMFDKLEADDVMGIYATDPNYFPDYCKVIVTIDKDLKQIPSFHYNPEADFEPWEQNVLDADKLFFAQWLAGDMTDGYSGCSGIGIGSAKDMADEEPFMWEQYEHTFKSGKRKGETEIRWQKTGTTSRIEQIKSCYMKAGHSRDEMIANGYVARILRHGEYDFINDTLNLKLSNSLRTI